MKSVLVSFVFMLMALMLDSAGGGSRGQVIASISASEILKTECVIPEERITPSCDISVWKYFRVIPESYQGVSTGLKDEFLAGFNKFYLEKAVDIIPLKQTPFRQIMLYSPEESDSDYLV